MKREGKDLSLSIEEPILEEDINMYKENEEKEIYINEKDREVHE
jgi:hypothetical protein